MDGSLKPEGKGTLIAVLSETFPFSYPETLGEGEGAMQVSAFPVFAWLPRCRDSVFILVAVQSCPMPGTGMH